MKLSLTFIIILMTSATLHGQALWFGSDLSLQARNGNQTQLISETSDQVELICRTSEGGAWVHVANETTLRYYRANGDLFNTVDTEVGLAAIAVDAQGAVWATRPGLDDVIRYQGLGSSIESFPVGGVPYGISIAGNGSIWVSCSFSNEAVELSADGVIQQRTDVGFFPTGISATHDGGAWLAEKQGLRRLDSDGQTVWTGTAGVFPIGVTTDIQGRGWFSCQTSNEVVVVSETGIDFIVAVAEKPLGISAHSDGSVSVLCRLGGEIQRISASGIVQNSAAIDAPGGFGDLTGLQTALVVAPLADFDGDGMANAEEVLAGTDPFRVPQQLFIRGDVDRNGSLQLTDAILTLSVLFSGGSTSCLEAVDANADDDLNLVDPILILEYLFMDSAPPTSPFPLEGLDPAPIPGFPCPQ